MKLTKKQVPGIVLCAVIAACATFLSSVNLCGIPFEVVGAPVFAILLGMIITLI